MKFDLENLTVTVRRIPMKFDKPYYRLTVDYPAEPVYRDAIMNALADLIRPRKEDAPHSQVSPADE